MHSTALRFRTWVTGSVAGATHGVNRSTFDLDIVIDPDAKQIREFVRNFPSSDYYADEHQALAALANRSQFNVMDFASGWKADFIIAEDSEYGSGALARRRKAVIGKVDVSVTSPEDLILAKLRWSKLSGSERQLEDVRGIVKIQGAALDVGYIERWARELGVEELWKAVSATQA